MSLHHHFYLNIIIIKTLNNTQQSNYADDDDDNELIGRAECLNVGGGACEQHEAWSDVIWQLKTQQLQAKN